MPRRTYGFRLTIQNQIDICSPCGIEGSGFSLNTGGPATLGATKHGCAKYSVPLKSTRLRLRRRKIYNGAARVALREVISAQELAEQAAKVFFPQTSRPTDTT
ncbi:hypothetical protein HPB48_011487 [Haemaphysalis longicornis]|uniref:Uncharacterized protein n=1 Tax=Haemaphysalis longicornis TaxID=44386 RepID=A0A9J6FZW8_HAELO|nr:hypothetical protein HPB48_011487 [Haemaphysalis longicornis]